MLVLTIPSPEKWMVYHCSFCSRSEDGRERSSKNDTLYRLLRKKPSISDHHVFGPSPLSIDTSTLILSSPLHTISYRCINLWATIFMYVTVDYAYRLVGNWCSRLRGGPGVVHPNPHYSSGRRGLFIEEWQFQKIFMKIII